MPPVDTDTPLSSAATGQSEFDRFLLLLGRLNYSWTNTESLLIHLIAGLSKTDKETAVVIFLTLNTTRARIGLVERLSKLPRISQMEREAVLGITRAVQQLSGLRNQYNHCIYSFDTKSGDLSTIRMRVADRKNQIKVGEMTALDSKTIDGIESSLVDLAKLNTEVWALIKTYGYPA
ncbi:hypothetical protein [Litoreibacter arenae]|uniref:Uncharacterized protein n=1 Tax=Litoreibacter arenae DSM 19593 TaxID=1123360 RepID=S9QMD8_9RHOB|nr:hypothetical protein [Litoreibacter arenae]EPX80748.1 hypothetical protein thalar_00968 [Litoreibacter arenae DSM 19593]